MKVAELIELLRTLPPDMVVQAENYDQSTTGLTAVLRKNRDGFALVEFPEEPT